jgi:hypothetical protein
VTDALELTTTLAERQAEEPLGRWENRCAFAWRIEDDRYLICDHPREHRGLHIGVDVGLKRDSTAVVAVQRDTAGALHVIDRFWVPTEADHD